MKLVTYEPHMHSTGVRMCLEAIYARVTETLNCAGYDHNWVRTYTYQEHVAPLIPKRSIIHATARYDTSSKNNNVLDPRNLSTYGNSSVTDMRILFHQAIFLTEEQYQEELAMRREHLDLTQGWDNLIGCPGCYEKTPTRPGANRVSR